MSDELKTKIDWSCRFAKHKYEIYEGCLRIVEHTNLAYVEPHKVIINNRLYLFFNEQKNKELLKLLSLEKSLVYFTTSLKSNTKFYLKTNLVIFLLFLQFLS